MPFDDEGCFSIDKILPQKHPSYVYRPKIRVTIYPVIDRNTKVLYAMIAKDDVIND